MLSLLLAVIYMAFISLGLPDSLLGSAWPVMHLQFGAELSFAGVVSMIIAAGTIVSSLLSERMTRRFGAARVTAVSVAMTAAALFGFSLSASLWQLCLWAVPYGLGAGAIDAALNNFVALHYSSRHMSWLHCFWGVGASISPYIMGAALTRSGSWQLGYQAVGVIQIVLTALLFLSLPLWKAVDSAEDEKAAAEKGTTEAAAEEAAAETAEEAQSSPQWLTFLGAFGIIVREGLAGASPVPSKRPYNIDPLCQLVEPYRTSQEWIIGQDQFCVRDTALYLTFLGHIQ